jgi:predicted RNA-binding Zn-ribbon protein involved in translation (DUF1610 family)
MRSFYKKGGRKKMYKNLRVLNVKGFYYDADSYLLRECEIVIRFRCPHCGHVTIGHTTMPIGADCIKVETSITCEDCKEPYLGYFEMGEDVNEK